MIKTAFILAALAATTVASPPAATGIGHHAIATTAASPILIKNATVMTVTKGTLTNTDVLIQNGKITQIGKGISAPAGATVIDGTGKFVTPGIIDAHSHIMSDATNEGTLSVTSMVRIRDVLNPTDPSIYYALAGGVTTINVLHGSANSIGGQNAVVKLKWGKSADDMVFAAAPQGIKFALGENVTTRTGGRGGAGGRYPATRMGQEEVIRDALTRAQDYKAAWDDYNARVAKDKTLVAPRRDLELEPLVQVMDGSRLVHAHSYRSDEMLMLLEVSDDFHFKLATFQHGLEGYKIATEIAAHKVGLSTFADFWSYKIEAYDAIPYNVAINMRHGVVTSINSDDAPSERDRRLNVDAEKMMRYGGLTEDEALKIITINPAIQLGVDKHVGSIEQGKDADVVVWNANPLSVYATVETTIIDGDIYFDKKKDADNRAAMARERVDLEKAEANTPPANRGGGAGNGAPAGGGQPLTTGSRKEQR